MSAAAYVNPFGPGLARGRVDQGVDYSGKGTIGAIGDAVIERVSPQGSRSGWPGAGGGGTGAMIVYRLTGGPRKGQHVYLAENVDPVAGLKVGQAVKAGDPIARARGAYPYLESGWSNAAGVPLSHSTYTEGQKTAGGLDFASFVEKLNGKPSSQVDIGSGATIDPKTGEITYQGKTYKSPKDFIAHGPDETSVGAIVRAVLGDWLGGLWDFVKAHFGKFLLKATFILGGAALAAYGIATFFGVELPRVPRAIPVPV